MATVPSRAYPFMNRDEIRGEMRKLVYTRRAEGRLCLMFVYSFMGLGATALARELHHDNVELLGQLIWVSGRDSDGIVKSPGQMAGEILRALGVLDADQSRSFDDRIEQYQRLSRSRTFLLVIDDAVTSDQVIRLLPDDASKAVVLVTTRAWMEGLVIGNFTAFPLDRLSEPVSLSLFRDRLGAEAARINPDTLVELVGFCDGNPLLIRILAARLGRSPREAERLLPALRGSIAPLLTSDDARRLSIFLDTAYQGLTRNQQLAYRRLSLLPPGDDFTEEAAAIALETGVDQAGELLDDLVERCLLTRDESIRYRFHNGVVRADARDRARSEDSPELCREVTARLVTWYLQRASRYDLALADRWRVGALFATTPETTATREHALAWFDREWSNVVACVRVAHENGLTESTWDCCVALFKYLHLHGYVDPWIEIHTTALESAKRCGSLERLMQLYSQRGAAYLAAGDLAKARADFEESAAAARAANHALGLQSTLEWLGKVASAEGNSDAALARYDQSWDVIDQAGDRIAPEQKERGYALLRLQRSRERIKRSEWAPVRTEVSEALACFRQRGEREAENQAKCWFVLGQALFGEGAAVGALDAAEHAVELFERDGARRPLARALHLLGDAAVLAGDRGCAERPYRRALSIFDELGATEADVIRQKLADLGY
jgi:tetratricopeptide (TPR) repeat protein